MAELRKMIDAEKEVPASVSDAGTSGREGDVPPDASRKVPGETSLLHPLPPRISEWVVRIAFTVVFAWNVVCAVQFICWPADYIAAYQLEGAGGIAAIQGMGVAFLMWNATYPLFVWRPGRYRVLGGIIIVQQAIGLVGELFIASGLGAGQKLVSQGIARFVGFDAIGLVLLCVAFYFFTRFAGSASGNGASGNGVSA